MENTERVRMIVSDVLEIEPAQVREDTRQSDLAEWDSLAQLRLVAALEQEFGVRPTMREIAELNSIPAIERYLDSAIVS